MGLIGPIGQIWKGALLLSLFTALYLIRYFTVLPSLNEGDFVKVTGYISEDPSLTGGGGRISQKLKIGQFSLFVDRFPEYQYGDRVVAEGVAKKGKYGWYLEGARICSTQTGPVGSSSHPTSSVGGAPCGRSMGLPPLPTPVFALFYAFRQRTLSIYQKYFSEPHSALLSGIVLGTKSSLDSQFFEALRKTGTLHVVVASGTNISIFFGSIVGTFASFMGRKRSVMLSFALVWIYVSMVGWQPPIVRAAIMGSIAFIAQGLGRENDAWRALVASSLLMLLVNPLWLMDKGFQLSFAATAGILGLSGRIGNRLGRVPTIFRENLATTLSAQIAVSPILAFSFGASLTTFLISPFVNMLILWTIPWIMAGGAAVGVVGGVWEVGGRILSWFVWILLEYFVRIVELFAKLG